MESGESSETAAYRELKEETGISDQDIVHIINVALMFWNNKDDQSKKMDRDKLFDRISKFIMMFREKG